MDRPCAWVYIPQPQIPAVVVARVNRFRVEVDLNGLLSAYLPNSGRMRELIHPGASVFVSPAQRPAAKTSYDLLLVRHGKELVSVDSRLPNLLMDRALKASCLPELGPLAHVRREVRWRNSRFDFSFLQDSRPAFLEVKSVTKVIEGVGLFPDAVTARGDRHLRELMEAHRQGFRAVVFFIVQRSDAQAFGPDWAADPVFSASLVEAHSRGIEIYARKCDVSLTEVCLADPLPIIL